MHDSVHGHRRDIDGLRAIAIIAVMMFHAGSPGFSGGFIGVDVFFVISGFLITRQLTGDSNTPRLSIADFIIRRLRRILPALLTLCLVTLLVAPLFLLPDQLVTLADSAFAATLLHANFYFQSHLGYFTRAAELEPLLHLWTLSLEEQFYLLYPIPLLILLCLPRYIYLPLISLALLVSLGLAQAGGNLMTSAPWIEANPSFWNSPVWSFYMIVTRAWEFLAGGLCALSLVKRKTSAATPASVWHMLFPAAGLLMIAGPVLMMDAQTPTPSIWTSIPVLGTCLILLSTRHDHLAAKLLSQPLLVAIGLISYGTYLWHQPILAFYRNMGGVEGWPAIAIALTAFVPGYLSWRYIERPTRQRDILSTPRFLILTLAGAGLILLIAQTYKKTDGFLSFYSEEDQKLYRAANYDLQATYVNARFNALSLKSFRQQGKARVFVIGDSFAQDLVNALYESNIAEDLDIATWHISADCGNLALPLDRMKEILNATLFDRCQQSGWYESDAVIDHINQADLVIMTSSWTTWHLDYLAESLSRFQTRFHDRYLVIGTKSLGPINIRALLDMPKKQRYTAGFTPTANISEINTRILEIAGQSKALNIQPAFCPDPGHCMQFDAKGNLISYDGGHLTKEGATFLGAWLKPRFRPLITSQ